MRPFVLVLEGGSRELRARFARALAESCWLRPVTLEGLADEELSRLEAERRQPRLFPLPDHPKVPPGELEALLRPGPAGREERRERLRALYREHLGPACWLESPAFRMAATRFPVALVPDACAPAEVEQLRRRGAWTVFLEDGAPVPLNAPHAPLPSFDDLMDKQPSAASLLAVLRFLKAAGPGWRPLALGAMGLALSESRCGPELPQAAQIIGAGEDAARELGVALRFCAGDGDFRNELVRALLHLVRCLLASGEQPWHSMAEDGLLPEEALIACAAAAGELEGGKVFRGREALGLLPSGMPRLRQRLLSRLLDHRFLHGHRWLQVALTRKQEETGLLPSDPAVFLGASLEVYVGKRERFWPKRRRGVQGEGQGPANPGVDFSKVAPPAPKPPDVTLDDLVLPEEEWWRLRDGVDAYLAEREAAGKAGAQAPKPPTFLLTGPPGTGKTFAAKALAGSLGLPLKVALAHEVLDKYVGTTERNLSDLFHQAAEAGELLFLDEADTFVWSRRDATKQWEASFTNTLLVLLDRREVPVVLATNLDGGLDSAVFRRMTALVRFPLPGEAERLRLWARALKGHPWAVGVEVAPLARVPLTGGLIDNAVLAVDRSRRLGRVKDADVSAALLRAAEAERQKLDPADQGRRRGIGFAPQVST